MQWDGSRNAGFTSGENTWLPINAGYQTVNVEKGQETENSLLNTLRELLKIRKQYSALHGGSLELVSRSEVPGPILMYNRKSDNEEVAVVLNFSNNEFQIDFNQDNWNIVFSLNPNDRLSGGMIKLAGFGGMILDRARE